MGDIPGEGSTAGTILALLLVTAPTVAIVCSALIKPLGRAYGMAFVTSCATTVGGSAWALKVAPGSGTWHAIWLFGGLSFMLSGLGATITVGGRYLARQR